MSRRTLVPVLAVALLVGCVPVTEPVGDVDKAEPDKRLVGRWQLDKDDGEVFEIDVPEVKGHPKGLMRSRMGGEAEGLWFHLTTIGKHTYSTIYLDPARKGDLADFREPGAFGKWQQGDRRWYFVFKYTLDGDSLVVDGGNTDAFKKLMADEQIGQDADYYKTPAGWLAKYLEKAGPDKVFDGTDAKRYKRVK